MEIKMKRYVIKYKEGICILSANNVEEAIERFKKLSIETSAKELTIVPAEDVYKRHKEIFGSK
jgi:hypothetical protein